MSFTSVVVVLVCVVGTTLAAPQLLAAAPAALDEYDPNPQYQFSYSVNDPLSGDSHGQSESRQGDSVQGSYSLQDADGSRRIVTYTADPVNGFNAVVSKEASRAIAPARAAYRL